MKMNLLQVLVTKLKLILVYEVRNVLQNVVFGFYIVKGKMQICEYT